PQPHARDACADRTRAQTQARQALDVIATANLCRNKRRPTRGVARVESPMFEARRQYRSCAIAIARDRPTSHRRRGVTRWNRRDARRCGPSATHRWMIHSMRGDAVASNGYGANGEDASCDVDVSRVKKREVCAEKATAEIAETAENFLKLFSLRSL